MKTLKKIVFIGLLVLIACAGVAQAQELYKDEKAPMHERIMDSVSYTHLTLPTSDLV